MSLVNKPTKTVEAEDVRIHRIRITLSSRNVKNLEKGEFGCIPREQFSRRPGC